MKRYYIGAGVVIGLLVLGVIIDARGADLSGVAKALTWAALATCLMITVSYAALLNFQASEYGRQNFAGYLVASALIGTSLLRQYGWSERDAATSVIMGSVILLGAAREALILRKGGVRGRVSGVSRSDGRP